MELAGKCFDLRGLCADPCSLPERDAALASIRAIAIESGVAGLPEAVVLQAELEEVRLRLVKAAKDGKHKYWFAEDGTVNDSGTVTRHHEVVVRTTTSQSCTRRLEP